jgi:hypothetical protein
MINFVINYILYLKNSVFLTAEATHSDTLLI